MPKRTTARRAHAPTINDALTREGTRVRYAPGDARPRPSTGLPKVGELGTTELTLRAGRRKVYDPEVGGDGGVVYVRWDEAGLFSVPPSYLRVVRRAADPDPAAGAEKARKFVDEEGARTLAQRGAGRICPEVNDSRDTSRPIIPTVHRELVRLGLVQSGGRNLDLGGGKFEKATGFMAENGVTSMVVDPSRTPEHNDAVWRSVRERPVDSVTVANVLNVICSAAARQELIGVAAGAVRPGGIVAFQIYDGDKSGVGCKTTDGWQEHRKPPTYLAEIQRWFGRVERKDNIFYAYEPRARPVGEIPPDAPMKECSAKRKKNPGEVEARVSNPREFDEAEELGFDRIAAAGDIVAARRAATQRYPVTTVALAAAHAVSQLLERMDRARLLDDDRPEMAVEAARRRFRGEAEAVAPMEREMRERAKRQAEPQRSANLAAAGLLTAALSGMSPGVIEDVLSKAVRAQVKLGDSREEAAAMVTADFVAGLRASSEVPRGRSNPGGVDVLATERADEPGFVVLELSAGLDRRTAGQLELRRMEDEDVSADCMRSVRLLRRRHPERHLGVLVVSNVRVEPWARGRGVGVALYAEAARLAASRFASVIIAHECVDGQTSVEAERVWESSRFREQVDVVGRAAYAPA